MMNTFRRNARAWGGLEQRLLSALVALPSLFAIIWFGEPWFSIAVATVALLGLREFYALVSIKWGSPVFLLGALGTILFILNAQFAGTDTMAFVAAGIIGISFLLFPLRRHWKPNLAPWAWTVVGIFLFGWTLSYLVLLRDIEDGREWMFLVLAAIFAADTGAYFVGRALGRRRLAPKLSPGKTWEGAVGGVAGALGISVFVAFLADLPISVGEALALGAIVSVLAPLGDLSESYLKRKVGEKEAGSLVPGHGGLMDRLDSIVVTIVVLYYYVQWVID